MLEHLFYLRCIKTPPHLGLKYDRICGREQFFCEMSPGHRTSILSILGYESRGKELIPEYRGFLVVVAFSLMISLNPIAT